MTDIDFCNSTASIYNSIVDVCSSRITSLSKCEVEEIYCNWNKVFDGLIVGYKDCKKPKDKISTKFNIPNDADHLGIDFPTWINFRGFEEERKRIMIIGIDPLRNDANEGNVELGTPYALHHENMRTKRTKQYWQFIELLSKDFSLYLTDIYKVFYYYNGKLNRSYNDLGFTKAECHHEILKQEVEIIKPNIIIAMGKQTINLLIDPEKLSLPISSTVVLSSTHHRYNGIPIIPMVHLSGMAAKHINSFLKANGKSNQEHGKQYYQLINEYLSL